MNDTSDMTGEDANDIVQNALKTVHEKCRSSTPKGTFIQWAQTVLLNKYKEYSWAYKRNKKRLEIISQEEYEPIYTKRISEIVSKRKSEKEVVRKEDELNFMRET